MSKAKADHIIDECMNGGVSAIVLKENLIPVEGADSPFFPPTFAPEKKRDPSDYCIDVLRDGTQTCLIDTVGSQANRMEPLFTKEPYAALIPQILIEANDEKIHICDVGHRAADALLRHSSIYDQKIRPALDDLPQDATKLAKLNPTSLIFGLWDSRETMVKIPRIVSSVIRAYDISSLTRSAQYAPPVDYKKDGLLGDSADTKEFDNRSSLGFQDVPSTARGGIIAHGGIQKDTVINLAALRKITASDKNSEILLQKYILGLALVAATSVTDWDLRQGCNLIRDPKEEAPTWNLVYPNGSRKKIDLNHDTVLSYAQDTAKEFGVGSDILDAKFNVESAKKEIKNHKKK